MLDARLRLAHANFCDCPKSIFREAFDPYVSAVHYGAQTIVRTRAQRASLRRMRESLVVTADHGPELVLPTPPSASTPAARRIMQGNRRRDTRPELAVRREAHRRGLRYRVDVQPVSWLRRRADLVFFRDRIAVFIDGCFWHGCPEHYKPPSTNSGYWSVKVAGNVRRDRDTDGQLANEGWQVIRAWEHQAPTEVVDRIIAAKGMSQ
jgi:DNA mismatch endonuclease (patch repair protein)